MSLVCGTESAEASGIGSRKCTKTKKAKRLSSRTSRMKLAMKGTKSKLNSKKSRDLSMVRTLEERQKQEEKVHARTCNLVECVPSVKMRSWANIKHRDVMRDCREIEEFGAFFGPRQSVNLHHRDDCVSCSTLPSAIIHAQPWLVPLSQSSRTTKSIRNKWFVCHRPDQSPTTGR